MGATIISKYRATGPQIWPAVDFQAILVSSCEQLWATVSMLWALVSNSEHVVSNYEYKIDILKVIYQRTIVVAWTAEFAEDFLVEFLTSEGTEKIFVK